LAPHGWGGRSSRCSQSRISRRIGVGLTDAVCRAALATRAHSLPIVEDTALLQRCTTCAFVPLVRRSAPQARHRLTKL
jgi:hypothetical protein